MILIKSKQKHSFPLTPTMMVTLGTISGKQGKKGMQIMCYTTIQSFYGVIYIWGWFFCQRVSNKACMIILDGYLHFHFTFSALHNLFCHLSSSLSCSLHPVFHAFFPPVQLSLLSHTLSLYFPFLCVAASWLSHALQAWWYPDPRGNYWENISGYQRLSGYAPSQFLQLVLLKSWMKNDNI